MRHIEHLKERIIIGTKLATAIQEAMQEAADRIRQAEETASREETIVGGNCDECTSSFRGTRRPNHDEQRCI